MNTPYDPDYADETNDTDLILPYDDSDLDGLSQSESIAMLMEEGYSEEEATRMVGLYDSDEDDYCYGDDDLDRDVPDFVDDGDFE